MNTETLTDRKQNLIFQVKRLEDEISVRHIEEAFSDLNTKGLSEYQREMLKKLAKPIKEKIDLEELKLEQNWKPSSSEEIHEIIKGFDWQISDEEFLKILKDD